MRSTLTFTTENIHKPADFSQTNAKKPPLIPQNPVIKKIKEKERKLGISSSLVLSNDNKKSPIHKKSQSDCDLANHFQDFQKILSEKTRVPSLVIKKSTSRKVTQNDKLQSKDSFSSSLDRQRNENESHSNLKQKQSNKKDSNIIDIPKRPPSTKSTDNSSYLPSNGGNNNSKKFVLFNV